MTFSQPAAGGDTFTPAEHHGKLLLIFPKSFEPAMKTSNGDSAAADADIVVVDTIDTATGRPKFFSGARLFGNLAKSVRNDLGGQVLGRLGQGPNTRGTPPWILTNFTDADAAAATPLLAQYQQGLFKPTEAPGAPQQFQGAQPASAPPQQAYGAPAATPAPQQQWAPPQQQYAAPAPAGPPAAPAPAPAPAGGVEPALVAFLASKGVQVTPGMTQQQAEAIAAAFPA